MMTLLNMCLTVGGNLYAQHETLCLISQAGMMKYEKQTHFLLIISCQSASPEGRGESHRDEILVHIRNSSTDPPTEGPFARTYSARLRTILWHLKLPPRVGEMTTT